MTDEIPEGCDPGIDEGRCHWVCHWVLHDHGQLKESHLQLVHRAPCPHYRPPSVTVGQLIDMPGQGLLEVTEIVDGGFYAVPAEETGQDGDGDQSPPAPEQKSPSESEDL